MWEADPIVMSRFSSLGDIGSFLIGLCALVVTVLILRREFSQPADRNTVTVQEVTDWESLARHGHQEGEPDAPVTIIEFADFQCPYCARAQSALDDVLAKHGDLVTIVYRHYPIESIHPHAVDAALAAECSGMQGRFHEIKRALFRHQDSIGIASWRWFGDLADIPDLEAYEDCIAGQDLRDVVERDAHLADSLGIRATPTFIVNGRLFSGPPPAASWSALVEETAEEVR